MKFDPSGLLRAFDRMEKAAQSKGKDLAVQQGDFFNSMARKLGWQLAPSKDVLFGIYRKMKGRLKRKKGVTALQELARRQRARGTFARGWHVMKVESTRSRFRVWIGNNKNSAGIVEDKFHSAKTAARIVQRQLQGKMERFAKQVTGVF